MAGSSQDKVVRTSAPQGLGGRVSRWVLWAFLLPAMIPMVLLVLLPLFQTLFFSVTNLNDKNFDVRTLGLEVIKEGAPACDLGVPARVIPASPAARAGLPAEVCVVSLAGESLKNSAALRRVAGKLERDARQANAKSEPVPVVFVGNSGTTESRLVSVGTLGFDGTLNEQRDNGRWGYVGARNYRESLVPRSDNDAAKRFYSVLGTTLVWTVVNVFFHYTLGLFLALLLNRAVAGTKLYRVLLLLPWAVPIFVSAFAWRWLFNGQYGFFNAVIQSLGYSPIPWLSDKTWTFFAVTVTNIWLGVPFMMVSLLAGLQAIPKDFYEAASIDGCSSRQAFWRITLPLLRPVSTTIVLLGFVWTFNMFNVIWLIQGGGNSVEILATAAFRFFYEAHDYAMAATYGTLILAMLFVFSMVYFRVARLDGEVR